MAVKKMFKNITVLFSIFFLLAACSVKAPSITKEPFNPRLAATETGTTTAYKRTLLTGGTTEALDGISGTVLSANDFAFVLFGGTLYTYNYKDYGSAQSEDSPSIIVADTSPGNYAWQLQEPPGVLGAMPSGIPVEGGISGLTFSNNTADPSNDIDISEGKCFSETGVGVGSLSTLITKRLDGGSTWSAGTGNTGILNNRTMASSSTYHVYALIKDSDGSIDIGFLLLTDVIASSLPSGYSQYRWLGLIFTDTSTVICQFQYSNDVIQFQQASKVKFFSGLASTTYVSLDLTSRIPTFYRVPEVKLVWYNSIASGEAVTYSYDGTNTALTTYSIATTYQADIASGPFSTSDNTIQWIKANDLEYKLSTGTTHSIVVQKLRIRR